MLGRLRQTLQLERTLFLPTCCHHQFLSIKGSAQQAAGGDAGVPLRPLSAVLVLHSVALLVLDSGLVTHPEGPRHLKQRGNEGGIEQEEENRRRRRRRGRRQDLLEVFSHQEEERGTAASNLDLITTHPNPIFIPTIPITDTQRRDFFNLSSLCKGTVYVVVLIV